MSRADKETLSKIKRYNTRNTNVNTVCLENYISKEILVKYEALLPSYVEDNNKCKYIFSDAIVTFEILDKSKNFIEKYLENIAFDENIQIINANSDDTKNVNDIYNARYKTITENIEKSNINTNIDCKYSSSELITYRLVETITKFITLK